jgi:hypothetical protein
MLKTMKKMTFIACAAMLASAVAFTGCKGDQNAPQQKVQQVQTDIALALPAQVSGPLRMPGTAVQTNGATDFGTNGMRSIILVPFAKAAAVTTASERLGENISLGGFGDAVLNRTNDRGRIALFEGKEVPSGTSAFLFYGESNMSGTGFNTGKLSGSFAGQPSAFAFNLQPILENGSSDVTSDSKYTGLLAYLTSIAAAEDKESDAADYASAKKWYEYTEAMNEGYFSLFQNFASVKVLSSFGIQRMLTDLYKNLMKNAATDTLANNIKEAIANNTYATVDGSGNVTLDESLQGFPANLNLPDGAVALAFNTETHVFEGNATNSAAPYGTNLQPAQLANYVYPSSLWYYANSRIKTSEASQKEFYVEGADWVNGILPKYNKTSVNTKTRSIAIADTIQYAVARLDVKVKIIGGQSYLVDNNPITAGDVNHINHPAAGYPVSAVLVGGQKTVGFDFSPETYAGTATAMTIYDNIMTAGDNNIKAVQSDYSAANSTLVLESAEGADVYIAVEFTNNTGKDFYGADGIVPAGGKFYLVGTLAASAATRTSNRVFKQDYTTTANLTIKDLKSAYNTIPDLKTPQLEIGLLVDLNWKNGNIYNVEFE